MQLMGTLEIIGGLICKTNVNNYLPYEEVITTATWSY